MLQFTFDVKNVMNEKVFHASCTILIILLFLAILFSFIIWHFFLKESIVEKNSRKLGANERIKIVQIPLSMKSSIIQSPSSNRRPGEKKTVRFLETVEYSDDALSQKFNDEYYQVIADTVFKESDKNYESNREVFKSDKILSDIFEQNIVYGEILSNIDKMFERMDDGLIQCFGYRANETNVYSLYNKRYVLGDLDSLFNANKMLNFNSSMIYIPNSTNANDFFDESKNYALFYLNDNRSHFISARYNKDEKIFYIYNSSGNSLMLGSGRELKKRLVKAGVPENIIKAGRSRRQPDSVSCGRYAIYNLHREFFSKLRLSESNPPIDFYNKIQLSVYGMHMNEKIFSRIEIDSNVRCTEDLKNLIIARTETLLIEAQKKLIDKSFRYQKKHQRKFYEAFVEYSAEIKYFYSKELLRCLNDDELVLANHLTRDNINLDSLLQYVKNYEEIIAETNPVPDVIQDARLFVDRKVIV